MTPIIQSQIETFRREIARAESRKRAMDPGTEFYTEENKLIAECMRAIARLQSDVSCHQ